MELPSGVDVECLQERERLEETMCSVNLNQVSQASANWNRN